MLQVNNLVGFGASGAAEEVEYVGGVASGNSSSDRAPVTFHASAASGDLGIVWVNLDDASIGKHTTPTGWTRVGTKLAHGNLYFKELASGDLSSETEFLDGQDENAWCSMVYTGADFSGVTANDVVQYNEDSSTVGTSVVIGGGSGTSPIIGVIGGGCKNEYSGVSTGFTSHTADEVVEDGGKGSGEANGWMAAVVLNGAAADITTEVWTEGSGSHNSQVTTYLEI